MAYDKIVDGTKLDAALKYTANSIRAKTKGTENMLFDLAGGKGFGEEVAKIATGGAMDLTKVLVCVANLTDKASYVVTKGAVDVYKRKITA